MGTAIQAGLGTVVDQGAVIAANQAVSGELSLTSVAQELVDTKAKDVILAALTAGALHGIDDAFFNLADGSADSFLYARDLDSYRLSLSFTGQTTQALSNAVVKASLENLINGGDISKSFYDSLFDDARNALGQYAAGTIKRAFDPAPLDSNAVGDTAFNTAMKYITHAGQDVSWGSPRR